MTDSLVLDTLRKADEARQMGERHIRSFLITATRYLAPGSDLSALEPLGSEAVRSLPAQEFDRRLFAVCNVTARPPGK